MGSELVKTDERQSLASTARTAGEIKAQKKIINDVMKSVMKPDIHFGKIPGAGDKPALLKAGTETLASTFRLALTHETEDLSNEDSVRYRIRSIVSYSPTGQVLGDALGECSSDEKKYRWRRAVCDEEWEETDSDRRREVWMKGFGNNKPYKMKQVRTDPADIANTVLKMAVKRADAAAVLLVLGASDIFAQDVDEWDADMIAAMHGESQHVTQPQRKSETKKAPPAAKPKPKPAPAPAPEPTPEPEPEVVEGEVVDEGPEDADLTGYVDEAAIVKKGQSARGPWTLCKVKINDDEYTTFDTKLFEMAQSFAGTGVRVVFDYEQTDKGLKLTAIRADNPDDQPPF